jgi:signal-transduction protein with cAMP-binding, CBS, and nucleotidyltransferase domain
VHDVAEFLARHKPFDSLEENALAEIAGRTEVEYFPAQAVIFEQGASPRDHVRVIRRGGVELIDGVEVLEQLGERELRRRLARPQLPVLGSPLLWSPTQ